MRPGNAVDKMAVRALPALTLDAVGSAAASRWTLTRHLADERASFRHILDEVRRDFARALLQDRSLSIGDIASFCSPNRGVPPIVPAVDGSDAKASGRPDRSHRTAPD